MKCFGQRLGQHFFFFLTNEKGDSRVSVIVPPPMIHLGKPMGTTSSNRNSETPNSHTLQALLVSKSYQKLQLQSSWELEPRMWWNLSSHPPIVPHLLVVGQHFLNYIRKQPKKKKKKTIIDKRTYTFHFLFVLEQSIDNYTNTI